MFRSDLDASEGNVYRMGVSIVQVKTTCRLIVAL
jgi:hypothetical protein